MQFAISKSPSKSNMRSYVVSVFLYLAISGLVGCGGASDGGTNTTPTTSNNAIPLANAGEDQTVGLGATVILDGSASSDADGDTLAYSWVLDTVPDGSATELLNQTAVSTSFVADLTGSYTISLMVNDGTVNSDSDKVAVSVNSNGVNITDMEFSQQSGSCLNYLGNYFSNVTDIKRSMDFAGDVVISADEEHCIIRSNQIPNHDFNDQTASFATDTQAQNSSYEIPQAPQSSAQPTYIDLQITNVIFLNGTTVDLLAAACYGEGNEPLGQEKIGCGNDQINHPWRYDPMSSLNTFGTDAHNAHVQPDGTYHYHGNPLAMFDQNCQNNNQSSPVIGFAADGFPVYGPCFLDPTSNTVKKAGSSYALKNNGGPRQDVAGYDTPVAGQGSVDSENYDGQFIGDYQYIGASGDLDECNGMTINNQYGYYITDSYPWVLACYKGTPDSSFSKTGPALKSRLHSHFTTIDSDH